MKKDKEKREENQNPYVNGYTDPNAYNANMYSDPNAYNNANGYTDPNAYNASMYSDPNAYNASMYSDPNAYNANMYSNPNAYNASMYTDPNAYNANMYTDPNAYNANMYTDPNAYNANTYTDPNAYNANMYTDPNAYNANTYTDPNAYNANMYTDPNAYNPNIDTINKQDTDLKEDNNHVVVNMEKKVVDKVETKIVDTITDNKTETTNSNNSIPGPQKTNDNFQEFMTLNSNYIKEKDYSIIALILAICSLIFGCFPIMPFILQVMALVYNIKSFSNKSSNKKIQMVTYILIAIGFIISVSSFISMVSKFNDISSEYGIEDTSNDSTEYDYLTDLDYLTEDTTYDATSFDYTTEEPVFNGDKSEIGVIYLGNNKIELPSEYSDFPSEYQLVEYDDSIDDGVEANSEISYDIYDEDKYIGFVSLYNLSDEMVTDIEDLVVTSVSVYDSEYVDLNIKVEVANGLGIGSSYEDVIDLFGDGFSETSYDSDGKNYKYIYYTVGNISYYFELTDDVVTGISVYYYEY